LTEQQRVRQAKQLKSAEDKLQREAKAKEKLHTAGLAEAAAIQSMFMTTDLDPERWPLLVVGAAENLVTSCELVDNCLVILWAATTQMKQRQVLKALNGLPVVTEAKQRVHSAAKAAKAATKSAETARKV